MEYATFRKWLTERGCRCFYAVAPALRSRCQAEN